MNKYFNYTKDGIEVDVTKAMHHGDKKKEESKSMMHSPDISKHYFKTKEEAMKDAEKMGLKGIHSHKGENGETLYMAGPNHEAFMRKHKEMHKMKDKSESMDHGDKEMKEKHSEGYMHMMKKKKAEADMHMIKDGEHMDKPKKTKAGYHDKKKAKAGYHDKKKAKAEMSPKQKSALDKNKDGKISKEDFEMLRKDKKESKSMMHKDEDKDKKKKKIKPKMSYAQLLIDLTNKNSEEEE